MRIGIDLGGTKIEGIALDDDGGVLARRRVATPKQDYEGTVEAIASLAESLEAETSARASVGVGMPGAISPASGLVKNANSTWLIGRPLDRDLATRLGRPVRLANDANCFALSEAVDGAARDARVVFGVIVGTGTGGGVVVDRKVLTGPNAIAGEWGHNPLPWPDPDAGEWPGPPCYCGKTGCVETFLSGTGLARDYRQATGEAVEGPEIVARAGRGEAAADAALARYEARMAKALAVVLNILDPDVVVLGGGMSQVARLYGTVPRLWQQWSFSDRVDTRLRPPVHGDSSGVRGAAWLWGPGEG
jgi:fructokinase